jgi:hypothetical protein
MRKKLVLSSLVVCTALLLSNSVVLAANNWVGKWTLDVAASHYTGAPAPKSQTLTFEATAGGIKLTSHGVAADGTPLHSSYESKFDGKDVPWEGNPDADTATPLRIDDNNDTNMWKKGGKDVVDSKVTVSADGKTLTISQTGTNAKGVAVKNTVVFVRG